MKANRDIARAGLGSVICAALSWACMFPSVHLATHCVLWLADGVVLVTLLEQSRRRILLPIGLLGGGCFLGVLAAGEPARGAFVYAAGTIAAAMFLYFRLARSYDARRRVLHKSAFAVIMITLGAVIVRAAILLLLHIAVSKNVTAWEPAQWILGDAFGILLLLCCRLHLRRQSFAPMFQRGNLPTTVWLAALMLVTACGVLLQSAIPLEFLLFPALTLVVFKRGLSGGLIGLLIVVAIAVPATVFGIGPFHSAGRHPGGVPGSALMLLLLTFCLGVVYPLGSALRARGRLERLYRLLAYNSRDVITRVNLQGIRTYASPSVKEVLGWTPAEVTGVPAEEMMHPEDRAKYSGLLADMKQGVQPEPFVYRGRKRNGEYVWLEATIRLVEPESGGEAREYIATSRDVTQRMRAENELQTAYDALERLATLDGLTQVANRRRFEELLDREWRRAQREKTEVSLLMLDVDHFKQFNDALGHPAGDECLRQIATLLTQHVQRSSDVVARYGGEEFAVLLPSTSSAGAAGIATRICEALRTLELLHPQSCTGHVTCSIGVASCVPDESNTAVGLIEAADAALYIAKRSGRDRVQVAEALPA